jgi:hypothetical protein
MAVDHMLKPTRESSASTIVEAKTMPPHSDEFEYIELKNTGITSSSLI